MSVKLIGPFLILGATGLLIAAAYSDEPQVDVGSNSGAPAVVEQWGNWPVTADGAIRRELARIEPEHTERPAVVEDWESWPVTADGAIRRELAGIETERAGD